MDDALDAGTLQMFDAQIQQAIFAATGMLPAEGAEPAGGGGTSETGEPIMPGTMVDGGDPMLLDKLIQRAYGARFAQRRVPATEEQ
jgi:hypothetical protein